ncbi:MAG: hypothetical protein KUF77_09700 [Candidatus Thiodiazotropha sp. (ex Lucina aurantia)]|nr:hypothetical protein [Candidatus Thiodiazotropha taylori]MBV2097844.1 hypothetical protein [Candidatus Thiodiazotropha sp. (ex Codakia orbicularis)]MBV2103283.1 hypothetical protein [Candidatus Thiodiazotropha sp. (ex Lucina aurantia)]MBV2116354.1 hypothetical protein [Candidatus Thiodiazotropha sp. (ex Lucina aurantia)]
MKDFKPSPFDIRPPSFASVAAIVVFGTLDVLMGTTFFSVYTETIGLMSDAYLSELPIIGQVFGAVDPDASASHLLSILLAVFSVGTPIFVWSEIFRQNILDDPREWFQHPQHKILACLTGVVLLLVVALECTSLYTLIAREVTPSASVFVQQEATSGLMAFLSQNKGMGIGVSIAVAVINFVLALLTVRAFRALKSQE